MISSFSLRSSFWKKQDSTAHQISFFEMPDYSLFPLFALPFAPHNQLAVQGFDHKELPSNQEQLCQIGNFESTKPGRKINLNFCEFSDGSDPLPFFEV